MRGCLQKNKPVNSKNESMIKILLPVFNDLSNDYRVYRTARGLVEMGYSVHVAGVAYPNSPTLTSWGDGVILRRLPVSQTRGKWRYLAYNHQLAHLSRTEIYAAVHANDLDTLAGAGYVAMRQKIPLIYDSHELFTEQAPLANRLKERLIWTALERILIGRANAVITVCDSIADELAQRYNIKRPVVIRNMPPYTPAARTTMIHKRLGLPESQKIVLYQGGLLKGIGLENIVRLGQFLRQALLVIIGSGPLEAELQRLVQTLQLTDRVRFIPHVPFQDLAAYTASAHLGLILLQGEGLNTHFALPNKLFEYLMADLPIICRPLPELLKIISAFQVGFAIETEDLAAVAAKIEAFLADETLYQIYTCNARQAAQELNWDHEKEKLKAVYSAHIRSFH